MFQLGFKCEPAPKGVAAVRQEIIGDLAAEVEAVLPMLPEPLRGNLKQGYDAFSAQEDIASDENEDLFEECDNVFYKHEQLIIDILYETAKSFVM